MTTVVWRLNPYTGSTVWTYGNYGGPGWTGGEFTPPGQQSKFAAPPADGTDTVFRDHDRAYGAAQEAYKASGHTRADQIAALRAIIAADEAMLASLKDIVNDPSLNGTREGHDQRDAAEAAQAAFIAKSVADKAKLVLAEIDPNATGAEGDPATGMPWPGDDWGNEMGDAEQTVSPLVLDLNGDGVQTTRLSKSFTQGVHFNLDAKGLAENTAWVSKEDGLLVRDLNGDGKITSGRELFGNHTLLKNGSEAANGFEALKELDDNNDGVVDANDAAFSSLKVWKDSNSNGITDQGELLTLAQAGVKSFTVSYTSSDSTDANGNQHLQLGNFTKSDDSTQSMNDVWFSVDTARTKDTDKLAVSDEIADLPDFANIGNLRSLHQAMLRDDSGQLQALVKRYPTEALSATRDALLQDILFHWAGVQDVDPGSRAQTRYYGNAIGDARKLVFLEAVVGHGYEGTWCWGERDPNPHGAAAVKLLALYEKVKAYYGIQLDIQTVCRDDFAALQLTWDESTQTFAWDVSQVVSQLQTEYDTSPEQTMQHLNRLAQVLKTMGSTGAELLQQIQARGNAQDDEFSQSLLQMGGVQLVFSGTATNDSLSGNNENNFFYGHAGSDTLAGGEGGDTYCFNAGDGQDVVLDVGKSQQDAIRFGVGIQPGQIQLSRGAGVQLAVFN